MIEPLESVNLHLLLRFLAAGIPKTLSNEQLCKSFDLSANIVARHEQCLHDLIRRKKVIGSFLRRRAKRK
jgi:hypothetical protein